MKKNISWSFMALFLIINLLSSCATPASKFNYASRINTISSYEEFIRRYPDSPYVSEARKKIQKLKEEAAFKEAESKNSIAAYRHFIEMYPDSELVEKAKNRIAASEEEALIRTWRLGTVEAFQGFIESYPDGSYILEAKRRLEYLKAVAEGTIDVYLDFVREYPNSPFVKEAKSAFPILPLFDKKVGVVINVRKTCKKRSPKDVKNKIWEDLKLLFENLNIQAVDATDNQMSNVEILLVINYQESKSLDPAFSFLYVKDQFDLVRYQAWVMSHKQPSNLAVSAGDALGALLAEAIIGLFDPFLYERGSITIKDARTGEIYYYKNILAGERASTKFSYFRRLLRHSLLSKRSHNLFSKDLKERQGYGKVV